MYLIENEASNNSSVVACVVVAAVTFPSNDIWIHMQTPRLMRDYEGRR
jgi:hypothetical protein